MRYKVIACSVFARELSLLASRSESVLDITWLPQGLHSFPQLLRDQIQAEIDKTESLPEEPYAQTQPPEDYSAIILGFGLCSRAVAGLQSKRLPLVIPRSHDCVGILLGSHSRYLEEFQASPGTYWFSPGWIEQAVFPCRQQCPIIEGRYAQAYGQDNAEYLVQVKRDSLAGYSRAALIVWPELDRARYRRRVQEVASEYGWAADVLNGDSGLLDRIVNGRWDPAETLGCPPGSIMEQGDEHTVIDCRPAEAEGGNAIGEALRRRGGIE